MDAYYLEHNMPYFAGQNRQRGSGIGALVGGIGRIALPFIRNILFPAVKRIGREAVLQALPEVVDVLSKRKTPKEAIKQTAIKTARRQFGRGRKRRAASQVAKQQPLRKRRRSTRHRRTSKRKAASVTSSRGPSKRSRLSFFSNIKDAY